ncbi:MAG TPA: 30S ribosome-binding factor RbfA [Bacteroidota bacterium]|nr:30S ribosome-binding factor RbfA [Bacteroidota bacterium]
MTMRTDRVASVLKEEVGEYLTRECRDGSYGLITVTDVQISPDLRIAKIYVSILGNAEVKARAMKFLQDRSPELRSQIGAHVRIKFTPELHFFLDETLDRVEKIEQILRKIHRDGPSA